MRLRGIVQRLKPQAGQNHFELFGLAPGFSIAPEELDRAYLGLQSIVHPDRYANAADAERLASMQWTTRVNEAYRTLKSPVQRAKYLLELNGVDAAFETDTAMPKEFLMQQLEMRERIQEAKGGSDLDSVSRDLSVEKHEIEKQIEEKIDDKRDFAAARDLVRKLMFLEKLGEEIDVAHERLEA